MMAHECEFLSACCSAEPATDLDSTQEGILGYCSKCRDSTSFSCEEHTPGMIPKPVQSADAYSRTRNQGASTAPQVIT